jgi:SRSO17 transposase
MSHRPPLEEWLIAQWGGHNHPSEYWISNLPADTRLSALHACAGRSSWTMQLKGELGLDRYEGRSWLSWYHHTALVTAAHGFLTLERFHPKVPRSA